MKKYNFNEKELFDLFVNKDDMAIPITTLKPYRRDGYVYATDGKKLIRVKDSVISGEYEATDKMALKWPENNCDYSITDNDIREVLSKIPQEEETETVGQNIKCPECDGDGTVWWEYRDKKFETHEAEHDCPICDGSGYIEKTKTMKTGRMMPSPTQIIKVGKNNIVSRYLKTLLDAMHIIGVSEVGLVCQTGVFNHFKIDDNISIMFASNSLAADYEMPLSGYKDSRERPEKPW